MCQICGHNVVFFNGVPTGRQPLGTIAFDISDSNAAYVFNGTWQKLGTPFVGPTQTGGVLTYGPDVVFFNGAPTGSAQQGTIAFDISVSPALMFVYNQGWQQVGASSGGVLAGQTVCGPNILFPPTAPPPVPVPNSPNPPPGTGTIIIPPTGPPYVWYPPGGGWIPIFIGGAVPVTFTEYITDTTLTTWHVPASWNPANNRVDLIAAGGRGADGTFSGPGGGGGGAGGYAFATNIALAPGELAQIQVGNGGSNSFLKDHLGNDLVDASGGADASGAGGGAGGGLVVGDGGNPGGSGGSAGQGGGGGGGAGGPDGAGQGGGDGDVGGGGGGGSNGGNPGNPSGGDSGAVGGNGGPGAGGGGAGGAGGTYVIPLNDGQGGAGGGGAGGGGGGGISVIPNIPFVPPFGPGGQAGGDTSLGAGHGAGAGGGGGGGANSGGSVNDFPGAIGGNSQLYGGGGAGGGQVGDSAGASGGGSGGAQGVIKIQWTSGGAPPYTAEGVNFDGSTRLNIAALAGIANTNLLTFSYWFQSPAPAAPPPSLNSATIFVTDPTGNYTTFCQAGNSINTSIEDVTGSLDLNADSTAITDNLWHNVIVSADTSGAGLIKVFLDALDATNIGSNNCPFGLVFNGLEFVFGGDGFGPNIKGNISDFQFFPGKSILVAGTIPPANLQLFVQGGSPVNPTVAAAALGQAAILYTGDATTFGTNAGYAGAAILVGGPLTTVAGPL